MGAMATLRILLIWACWGGVAVARANGLPPDFMAALQRAAIPLSNVALVVQPLDSLRPWLTHQAEVAFNPASVMKLVTSFAAFDQLGPAYTWVTEWWADGPLAEGVLDGNLVVRGNGDPALTIERLWLMQRALRVRGVRDVRGDLVLDTGAFELPAMDAGAFDGEPLAAYNAPPGALMANFNAISLRFIPGPTGVTVEPEMTLPGIAIRSRVRLRAGNCAGWRDTLAVAWTPTENTISVEGTYPRGCEARSWPLNLFEPASTFALLFRGLWAESGGTLAGTTVPGRAPVTPALLRFESEPLADGVKRLNKYSSNQMTRNLFLTLGAEAYGAPATLDKGTRAVRAALDRHGIATDTLVLENGSGLSRSERITAQAMTHILRAAWQSPWWAEFESALPIAGLDGTLARRFNKSPVMARAHLKTGSLRDVSALAGTVLTYSGRRVAFVLMVNHANAGQAVAAQQALLEWTWADGPNLSAP